MKIWVLRGLTFVLTLFLGGLLVLGLHNLANSHFQPVLRDLKILGYCPDPGNTLILRVCEIKPMIIYLIIALTLILAILIPFKIVKKVK